MAITLRPTVAAPQPEPRKIIARVKAKRAVVVSVRVISGAEQPGDIMAAPRPVQVFPGQTLVLRELPANARYRIEEAVDE